MEGDDTDDVNTAESDYWNVLHYQYSMTTTIEHMEPKNFKLVTTIFPIELAIWGLYMVIPHFWSQPHHALKSKYTCRHQPLHVYPHLPGKGL